MGYLAPPLVATLSLGVVVGTATGNMVVAGAGFRIRVVGMQMGINRADGSRADQEIQLTIGAGFVRIGQNYGQHLAVATGAVGSLSGDGAPPVPEPGILSDDGGTVRGVLVSNAAVGTGVFIVYYYIDES